MSGISRRAFFGLTLASAALTQAQSEKPGKKKVIVTGGHPGDPEYGCGGTIARLTEAGHDVVLLYLNRGDPKEIRGVTKDFPRVAEAAKACEILKARPVFAGEIDGNAITNQEHTEAFEKLLTAEAPDVVFTHWPIDNHADHRAMYMFVYNAWRRSKKNFALYFYEVSTGEDSVQFAPTEYVDIAKVEAVKRKACFAHASQEPERYYQLQNMVARMRGAESGHALAEGFVRHAQSKKFELPN